MRYNFIPIRLAKGKNTKFCGGCEAVVTHTMSRTCTIRENTFDSTMATSHNFCIRVFSMKQLIHF